MKGEGEREKERARETDRLDAT